jgi:DNA-binding transcriptional LysR family regulator
MRRQVPQLNLHITPGVSPELLLAVEDERLDAALMVQPAQALSAPMQWLSLRRERFVLLVPSRLKRGQPRELLSSSDFIRYDRSSHGGGLVDRYLKRMRLSVRSVVEVDSIEAMAMMVAQGVGVAIVPDTPCIEQFKLPVAMMDLGEHALYRHIGLVTRQDGPRQHLVKLFAQSLQAPVGD